MNRTIAADDLTAGQSFRIGVSTRILQVERVQDTRNPYTGKTLTITAVGGETVELPWNAFVTLIEDPSAMQDGETVQEWANRAYGEETITLDAIAAAMIADGLPTMHRENIGGGVQALVDFAGLTITIDGGQTTAQGPVEVLACRDGAPIASVEVDTVGEVVEFLHGHL